MCDGRATWQIGNLHRQAVLGWDVTMRGRFMSTSSIFSIGGYMVSSSMFQRFGTAASFEMGAVLSACWNAASALCLSGWHFFALIPFNSLSRGMAPIAISTATTLEGTRQGMAQGELQGARSNLQTIVRIFAPLVRLNQFFRAPSWTPILLCTGGIVVACRLFSAMVIRLYVDRFGASSSLWAPIEVGQASSTLSPRRYTWSNSRSRGRQASSHRFQYLARPSVLDAKNL